MFDAIELDDNETLSWEEFRRFFDDNDGKSILKSAQKAGSKASTFKLQKG